MSRTWMIALLPFLFWGSVGVWIIGRKRLLESLGNLVILAILIAATFWALQALEGR